MTVDLTDLSPKNQPAIVAYCAEFVLRWERVHPIQISRRRLRRAGKSGDRMAYGVPCSLGGIQSRTV